MSADGDPMDIDAMTKGKGHGKEAKGTRNASKGKSPNHENNDATDNQPDSECF